MGACLVTAAVRLHEQRFRNGWSAGMETAGVHCAIRWFQHSMQVSTAGVTMQALEVNPADLGQNSSHCNKQVNMCNVNSITLPPLPWDGASVMPTLGLRLRAPS